MSIVEKSLSWMSDLEDLYWRASIVEMDFDCRMGYGDGDSSVGMEYRFSNPSGAIFVFDTK